MFEKVSGVSSIVETRQSLGKLRTFGGFFFQPDADGKCIQALAVLIELCSCFDSLAFENSVQISSVQWPDCIRDAYLGPGLETIIKINMYDMSTELIY